MIVRTIDSLFRFGIKAYKHETINIEDEKKAKRLVGLGVVKEVKPKAPKKEVKKEPVIKKEPAIEVKTEVKNPVKKTTPRKRKTKKKKSK